MKLRDITQSKRPSAFHPEVEELLCRLQDDQDFDCLALDSGDKAFMGAIFHEVLDDPNYHPSIHMLELIRVLNAKMAIATA